MWLMALMGLVTLSTEGQEQPLVNADHQEITSSSGHPIRYMQLVYALPTAVMDVRFYYDSEVSGTGAFGLVLQFTGLEEIRPSGLMWSAEGKTGYLRLHHRSTHTDDLMTVTRAQSDYFDRHFLQSWIPAKSVTLDFDPPLDVGTFESSFNMPYAVRDVVYLTNFPRGPMVETIRRHYEQFGQDEAHE